MQSDECYGRLCSNCINRRKALTSQWMCSLCLWEVHGDTELYVLGVNTHGKMAYGKTEMTREPDQRPTANDV